MIRKGTSGGGWTIGVDVGGQSMKGGAAKNGRYMRRFKRVRTTNAREKAGGVADQIAAVVQDVAEKGNIDRLKVRGVGVAVPGPNNGRIIAKMPNFPNAGRNIKMLQLVTQRLKAAGFKNAAVHMTNDANAGGAAEWIKGVGKGGSVKEMKWFTISTGLGGVSVLGGKLHTGATGASGEPGHVVVVDPRSKAARLCGCGGRGHAEAHASAGAIQKIALEKRGKGAWLSLLEKGVSDGKFRKADGIESEIARLKAEGVVSSKAIFTAAKRLKDPVSAGIIDEASEHLATLLYNVHHLNNPQMMVLSGGAGEAMLPYAVKKLKSRKGATPTGHLVVVPGKLGTDAGVIGATLWPELVRKGWVS